MGVVVEIVLCWWNCAGQLAGRRVAEVGGGRPRRHFACARIFFGTFVNCLKIIIMKNLISVILLENHQKRLIRCPEKVDLSGNTV